MEQADIEQIRYQPLPETADELFGVARRLGVPDSEILLGADATEARLKALSEQDRLADYAIVILCHARRSARKATYPTPEPAPIFPARPLVREQETRERGLIAHAILVCF